MKKKFVTRISLLIVMALLISEAPVFRVTAFADEYEPTEVEVALQFLLTQCLTDIYGARTEETRVAREYLAGVKDLSRVNPYYYSEIPAAEERLREAIEIEERAKEEMENSNILETDIERKFPYVYLTPGLSTQPVSVTVPMKQACRIVINGIEAFSLLSTGRPCDPGSMIGLVSFIEPYACYPKWHITSRFYGAGQLMESVELSGEVRDPLEFRRMDNFVQTWRPGLEGATFRVYLADNHSVMVAWNVDGSVTVTDLNNFPQSPSGTALKRASSKSSKSSSGSNNTSSNNSSSGNTDSTSDTNNNNDNNNQSDSNTDSSNTTTSEASSNDEAQTTTVTATIANSNGTIRTFNAEELVWKSETGEKFHNINNCSNMDPDKAEQITVKQAVETYHLEACEKCYN